MRHPVVVTVNGRRQVHEVEASMLLSDLLRDRLALKSVRVGCECGACGACAVLVDGRAIRSCSRLALQADGAEVWTFEGLLEGGAFAQDPPRALDRASEGLCGYCLPGLLIGLWEAASAGATSSRAAVLRAFEGHLCRCGGYQQLLAAPQTGLETVRGQAPERAGG